MTSFGSGVASIRFLDYRLLMDLFYGAFSGNSSRAIFGLEESGLAYNARAIDARGGENKSAAYLAVNPMGKIPALTDGALRLWESNAINWYAAEKAPHARLIPSSLAGRASMQRWLFFQAQHVTPASIQLFRATNSRMQAFWQFKPDLQAAEQGRKELARYLPVLDQALADRDWLERDFSLADIAYAPHLWLIAEGGFDFTPYPAVRAWLDRLLARPAWRKTEELVFSSHP